MDRKVNPLSQSQLIRWLGAAFYSAALLWSTVSNSATASAAATISTPVLPYRVVAEYPHDTRRFTQGLAITGNKIIESSGGYGTSSIYIDELRSGRAITSRRLPDSVFGEGLAVIGERILVLTWRESLAFEMDMKLREVRRFKIQGEGWGLAAQGPIGAPLVQSNGSSNLQTLDPESLSVIGTLPVRDRKQPVARLNELEAANGWIFANVWLTPKIAVIQTETGAVKAWLDLTALYPADAAQSPDNVLNGIALDPGTGHFFVTGKRWPKMFEIEIDDRALLSNK